jgi:16S rRNA (cytidine1402-2'-O)-methyltransferase
MFTFGPMQPFGKLFLIPNVLASENPDTFIADYVRLHVNHIRRFIVETEKDARALIKRLRLETPQQELVLWNWNEHSNHKEVSLLLEAVSNGQDCGLITDAGLPCIADPGSDIVALAHQHQITVVPLPGASSILMALMASGLNGQCFAFNGYLPIDKIARAKKIKELELEAIRKNQTQLFMEAPYRNNQLLADVLKQCNPQTKLCVARNISSTNQLIQTQTCKQWLAQLPDLHKQPVIFAIG